MTNCVVPRPPTAGKGTAAERAWASPGLSQELQEALSVLSSEEGGGRCGAGVLSMHTEHGENACRGL